MMSPIVSVVMPVYNARQYLPQAVDSIAAQSFTDFEFIIVDDGSSDGSSDLLADRARRDPRIAVIRQPNAGMTRAMNVGVSRARGTYVARMDADDISLPARFAKQVAYLQAHPDCIAVGSALVMIDSDGADLCEWPWPLTHEACDAALLDARSDGGLAHPAAMIRRSAFDVAGLYDEKYKYAQDKDLWLRLAERGRLANLPDILLKYRMHLESCGSTRGVVQRAEYEDAIDAACRRRGIDKPPRTQPQLPLGASLLNFSDRRAHWAMSANKGRNYRTAWKHALAVVGDRPFTLESWILVGITAGYPLIRRVRRSRPSVAPMPERSTLDAKNPAPITGVRL